MTISLLMHFFLCFKHSSLHQKMENEEKQSLLGLTAWVNFNNQFTQSANETALVVRTQTV